MGKIRKETRVERGDIPYSYLLHVYDRFCDDLEKNGSSQTSQYPIQLYTVIGLKFLS